MKKILIALFILALIPTTSNAQNWLTLKGGGGLATSGGSEVVVAGLAAGGGIGYKQQISKRLMLEGDILLDTRAVSYSTGEVDTDGNTIYFLGGGTYIQVPMTVQYMIPFKKKELIPYRMGQPKTYWFIEGGPYVSYGTSVSTYPSPTIIATYAALDDPIDSLEDEHIRTGTIFKRISVLTNNYKIPENACNSFKVLYIKLQQFEEELYKHIHIENNILFPKAKKLEKYLYKLQHS